MISNLKVKPKSEGLSFWKKATFGSGSAADNLMQNSINTMVSPVFNIFLGVNPVLLSVAIFGARLWGAFTDPVMGAISDNTRGRFGRRRPYMLVGGILAALAFILLWQVPPGWPEIGLFLWFLLISLLFYTLSTVFSVPYNAMSYELSPDYNERNVIMAFRCFFGALAGIFAQWMYRLTQLECFKNTLDGMQAVSFVVAGLMVATTVLPALFSNERLARSISQQKKVRLIDSLKVTMRNRTFAVLIIAIILICLGLFMVGQLGVYINIFYVYSGDNKAAATMLGWGGTIYNLAGGVIAAPVISLVARRIGKKKTLLWGLMLAMVGTASKFFTYDPRWPFLQFVSLSLMSPGLACLWVLSPSMVADICDEDELSTGVRREGMYGAVYSTVMKIGVSIGLLAVGFILQASGFKAELGAAQPAQSIMILRICYAVIPTFCLLIGLPLISCYPITAEKAAATRAALDFRHAAV